MFIVFSVSLLLVSFISIVNSAYKKELEKNFASKQPHLKLEYISNLNRLNTNDIEIVAGKIKNIAPEKIKNIAAYSEGKGFFTFRGKGFLSSVQSNSAVNIIGISKAQHLPYDFMQAEFFKRGAYQIPYTPIEFLYQWIEDENASIFNYAFLNSFYPPVVTETLFSVRSDRADSQITLLGAFRDFNNEPTIYTSLQKANELLNQDKNHVHGFVLNLNNLNDLSDIKEAIDKTLNQPEPKFIIKSWLEEREKQNTMFVIFRNLAFTISFIILILSIICILLVQYKSIVSKSYQLNVFYTIGMNLKNALFMSSTIISVISTGIVTIVIMKLLPYMAGLFHLSIQAEQCREVFIQFLIILSVYISLVYITITSAFNLSKKGVSAF